MVSCQLPGLGVADFRHTELTRDFPAVFVQAAAQSVEFHRDVDQISRLQRIRIKPCKRGNAGRPVVLKTRFFHEAHHSVGFAGSVLERFSFLYNCPLVEILEGLYLPSAVILHRSGTTADLQCQGVPDLTGQAPALDQAFLKDNFTAVLWETAFEKLYRKVGETLFAVVLDEEIGLAFALGGFKLGIAFIPAEYGVFGIFVIVDDVEFVGGYLPVEYMPIPAAFNLVIAHGAEK